LKYVKGLDTIRALAVFFVIVEHWGPNFAAHTLPGYIKSALAENGQFGVNLFFVLSGFLITSILLNERIKNEGGKKLVIIKNFFARRFLRIFPIYYLVIFFCVLCNYTFVQEHIWYYITYTSNLLAYRSDMPNILSHTWSLAVEEQFYIIWPWLIILVNKKYLKHVLIASIVIGIVSRYIVLYVLHHKYPILVFNCFDSFGIGGMYGYIRLNTEKRLRFEKGFRAVFPLMLYLAWHIAPFAGSPVGVLYVQTLDSIIGVALIMFVLNNKSELIRKYLLENKVFNFIGKISYGIYLYHYTFGPSFDNFIISFASKNQLAQFVAQNVFINAGLKISVLLTICWLSYALIEQPILRLKKKFVT
jgi:peptidoglycan/LPS O-acetylase OafA/YrhL